MARAKWVMYMIGCVYMYIRWRYNYIFEHKICYEITVSRLSHLCSLTSINNKVKVDEGTSLFSILNFM